MSGLILAELNSFGVRYGQRSSRNDDCFWSFWQLSSFLPSRHSTSFDDILRWIFARCATHPTYGSCSINWNWYTLCTSWLAAVLVIWPSCRIDGTLPRFPRAFSLQRISVTIYELFWEASLKRRELTVGYWVVPVSVSPRRLNGLLGNAIIGNSIMNLPDSTEW